MLTLLAAGRVDVNGFVEGLTSGDPVAWAILGAVVLFSGIGLYQKFRSF
jgi:hypothetical protein